MNIILIGYRCCGKTTVGRILGQALGREFIDTDRILEARGGISIHSYVSRNGWGNLRELEKEIVKEVTAKDNRVIATGGGVVIDQENVRNLRKNGWIVWLDTEAPVIRDRMQKAEESGELRPPLSGVDPMEETDRILRDRIPYYESASDHIVDANRPSPEAVAREILMAFQRTYDGDDREGCRDAG